ncbi:MAG: hypothetical protein HRT52_18370 [Colwellia sp.]|nr:hypothetical protein [Colwellia sp.]
MTDKQSNTDQLHQEGALNKDDLHEDHIKAIDQLSQEEVEHLKAINKKVQKDSGQPVGIVL